MKSNLLFSLLLFFLLVPLGVSAHFGMIIPSQDIVTQDGSHQITLSVMFAHPFEYDAMPLEKPKRFGVVEGDLKTDLKDRLKETTFLGQKSWELSYRFQRPGVSTFYLEPQPYWESAEDCYIIHYTKVVISAFGLEDGWDAEIGLKTEIIPLTRPFGLYAGNVFQGIVKLDGNPVPFCEVEVEHFNAEKKFSAPAESFITQVIKTDGQGIFTYAAPKPGWWGFAALSESDEKIRDKDVELGAVLWVKFTEMK
ncbi:MAG TPA: DUF4198 domain-containing protein [Deltaproteobacteria bacterium]|nr:DUF4198 domain-containing protein [Deltaproteobacteria bacterium]